MVRPVPSVLLVPDSSRQEISTINQQVTEILRPYLYSVITAVLHATEEDIQDAKNLGVDLLLPQVALGDNTTPSLDWLTFDHRVRYPNIPAYTRSIVGYAGITSRAAVRIKQERFPEARVILFTTDIPEDTDYYKGDEKAMGIGQKEDAILEDVQEADVVFSLGSNIFDHFENQFRAIPANKRPQHVRFLARPSKIFEDVKAEYKDTETMVVLSICGVKGGESLKGHDLKFAAESLSITAEKMKVKWHVIVGNKDDFETVKAILEHHKSANLQIAILPYGTQKDIHKEMMQAHLVLMPSRAEPFGLVGLEAIAAGIPVLVSSRSGLADFIHECVDQLHHSIVDMGHSEEGATVRRLAHSIERVLKHNRAEFEIAARGKQQLLSAKYWEESHQQLMEACIDKGFLTRFDDVLDEASLAALERTQEFLCQNIDGAVINDLVKRLLLPSTKMNTLYEEASSMVSSIIQRKDKGLYDSLCDGLRDHGQLFIQGEMQKAAVNYLRETRGKTRGTTSTQDTEHVQTEATSAQDQNSSKKEEMVDVDPNVKAVILGETEAGKTSLCKSIIEGQNVMELKADRTIGVDICRYQDKESNIQYEIYDFGGHDVYHYTHRFFLTRHAIYITSADLPSYNSAEFQKRLGTWLTSVTTHVMNPAIIIVGTKADRFDPETATEDIERTCSQLKTDVENFEKSCRDLLTDDIKQCQDALDRIGNGDQPGEQFTGLSQEDIAAKKASLEMLLKGRPTSLQDVEVIPVSVNPENPQGLDKLLAKMAEMTKDKALFPNISQQVPKSWFDLREELKKTADKKYLNLDDCVKMAEPLQMTKEDVLNALSYWYVAGQILFYSNIEEVKNLVFPDPTGILKLFKDLFRHNMEEYLAGIANSEEFQKASTAFLETGTADEVFLQGVLGSKRKDFDIMLPILKHFGLCFSGSVKFPPQLPELSDEDMKLHWPELKPSHVEVTVNINYHAEPPVGLTESMISRIVSTDIGETSSKLLRRNTIILHDDGSGKSVLCRRWSEKADQIKVRAEPKKAWQLCQNLGKVIQDAQDEYLALHCTISVRQQNGLHLKELPFEALQLHTPAELIKLSHGKHKVPLTDGDKPTEQKLSVSFGKYYIENQLYEKICDKVGPEWLRLGTALSLSTSALDNIQYSGYANDTQRAFQTLKVFWAKASYGHMYKLKRLQDVLLEMGKTDLSKVAEDILKGKLSNLATVNVNPEEMRDEQGSVTWTLSLSKEGKYICNRTDLGFITPCPLDVTYKIENWSDHRKESDENWVAVGPLFNIQCDGVEGRVTLLLPHALDLQGRIDLSPEQIRVVHLVPGNPPELLEAEITPTHLVTQFKKGSDFGPVVDKEEANSIPWNALLSLFMSPEKRHGRRLKAYIVPNLKTVQQALKEDELQGKRKFEYWDHIVCSLKPGEMYCLKGVVLDVNVNIETNIEPKFPTGVEFLNIVDTSGYYKSFRIRVGKSTKPADAELELQLQLLNSDGEDVCTFTDFIDADNEDIQDSDDSGLFTDSMPKASGTSSAALKQKVRRSRGKETSIRDFPNRRSSPPKVLLISDKFGASGSDMSTLNLQVALLLWRYGAIVYSTVLHAPLEDEKCPDEDNPVQLIKPVCKPGDTRPPHLDWLTYDYESHYPHLPDVDFVVGYADITSTAAKNIHEDKRVCPRSELVLFNCEMPEEAAKYHGGLDAQTAAQKIVDEAENAHAIFSVGEKILEHFKSKYTKFGEKLSDRHYIYLPEPSQEFKDTDVVFGGGEIRVLSVGKVISKEKMEGHDLAGQTMGIVAKDPEFKHLQWSVYEIAPKDYETSKNILEDNLMSGKLKPTLLPYTTQQDIIDGLKTAHLVLMPSRAEPFGLFALEAIAAGVPVLISDKSGLADMILDLIKEKKIDASYRSQIVETSVHEGEGDTRRAAEEWAKRVKDTLKYLESEFKKAVEFKEELLGSKYWEDSQRNLLRVFGLVPEVQAEQD